MPRVSIITPAFNVAGVIGETLSSVREQEYTDWEHIVVDDGSTDATLEIVRDAAASEPRLRAVASDANSGPAAARNLGLKHARGELIALLDADDVWTASFLAKQVALYDREQARTGDVGIVACNAYLVDAGGRQAQTYAERFGSSDGVELRQMLKGNRVFISALVPRAVIDEVGDFATETRGSEDHDLWLRILETGRRVVATSEPLAVYRVAAGSVSDSLVGMARTNQRTYERALSRGRLSLLQRAEARRQLRLHRAVERVALLRANRRESGGWSGGHFLRAIPTVVLAVAAFPDRWASWIGRRARRSG